MKPFSIAVLMVMMAIFCAEKAISADSPKLLKAEDFVPVARESERLSSVDASKLQRIRETRGTKRATVVTFDLNALLSNVLTLEVPGDGVLTVTKLGEERRSATDTTWYGKTDNGGRVTISASGPQIYGIIRDLRHTYEIRGLSGKLHVFVEINNSKLPPDHPPGYKSSSKSDQLNSVSQDGGATSFATATTDAATPTVNVFVAYTPEAGSFLVNPSSAFQTTISQMNQSFADSGVSTRAALVGHMKVSEEYLTLSSALSGVKTFGQVLTARDNAGADVVVIVTRRTENEACGLADKIMATPSSAFAAVTDICLNTNLSMAHEIGHLLGARHDPANDPATSPFPHGHGYSAKFYDPYNTATVEVCWHTIMGYSNPTCGYDPRINNWSNPSKMMRRGTVSHPNGVSGVSDVAAVLNTTGGVVSNFRNTKLSTGILSVVPIIVLNLLGL